MDVLTELECYVKECSTAPAYEDMPHRTLADKGIAGPTSAHVIEELHTPLNIACTTYTTGTSAFQTPVGICHEELPVRTQAGCRALRACNVAKGAHVLIAYPPLVNVFGVQALREYPVSHSFLRCSSRDAFLAALCRQRPDVVIGESSFIRAALKDGRRMGLSELIPKDLKVIAAGTPLDMELLETAGSYDGMEVHDLYGCQEFGWLAADGVALRDDIRLIPCGREHYVQISVGGLLTGDCFPEKSGGHILNPDGAILSYGRQRMDEEWVTTVLETTASEAQTVSRMARSILRLKSRIVRVSDSLKTGAQRTVLGLAPYGSTEYTELTGPEATGYIDDMLAAQIRYQQQPKNDAAWLKDR